LLCSLPRRNHGSWEANDKSTEEDRANKKRFGVRSSARCSTRVREVKDLIKYTSRSKTSFLCGTCGPTFFPLHNYTKNNIFSFRVVRLALLFHLNSHFNSFFLFLFLLVPTSLIDISPFPLAATFFFLTLRLSFFATQEGLIQLSPSFDTIRFVINIEDTFSNFIVNNSRGIDETFFYVMAGFS